MRLTFASAAASAFAQLSKKRKPLKTLAKAEGSLRQTKKARKYKDKWGPEWKALALRANEVKRLEAVPKELKDGLAEDHQRVVERHRALIQSHMSHADIEERNAEMRTLWDEVRFLRKRNEYLTGRTTDDRVRNLERVLDSQQEDALSNSIYREVMQKENSSLRRRCEMAEGGSVEAEGAMDRAGYREAIGPTEYYDILQTIGAAFGMESPETGSYKDCTGVTFLQAVMAEVKLASMSGQFKSSLQSGLEVSSSKHTLLKDLYLTVPVVHWTPALPNLAKAANKSTDFKTIQRSPILLGSDFSVKVKSSGKDNRPQESKFNVPEDEEGSGGSKRSIARMSPRALAKQFGAAVLALVYQSACRLETQSPILSQQNMLSEEGHAQWRMELELAKVNQSVASNSGGGHSPPAAKSQKTTLNEELHAQWQIELELAKSSPDVANANDHAE
ncbi:hypothetical protein IE81DRAFT_330776 [Ceraceosorus guamensis]|uniref:Uncharacterized protein n=1 Tax=Ceraceosorus guamensis TaxID=1522189 RepID=A0A316W1P1_9BASI|nr:hypothetical protein IE81DRAFT_330776 [Ceraceosorus guamensis]PWN41585.1 hypothetical protein IE81DRAFT_330776 [Ceraceosorus guamensis]